MSIAILVVAIVVVANKDAQDVAAQDPVLGQIREARSKEFDALLSDGYMARVRFSIDRHVPTFLISSRIDDQLYDIRRKDVRTLSRCTKEPGTGAALLDRAGWINAYDGRNSWEWDRANSEIIDFYQVGSEHADKDWLSWGLPTFDPFSEAIGLPSDLRSEAFSVRGELAFPFRVDVGLATGQYKVVGKDELVGQIRCVCVEREGLDKIWFDPERGWSIVQREWNWGPGLPIRARILNDEAQSRSGFWVPPSFKIQYFGKPGPQTEVLCATLHAELEEFSVGVTTEFVPPATAGSLISDHAANAVLYVVPDTPGISLLDFMTENGVSSKFEKQGEDTRANGARVRAVVIGNLAVIGVFLLVFALRRRFARPAVG